jgi:hypothetical protein
MIFLVGHFLNEAEANEIIAANTIDEEVLLCGTFQYSISKNEAIPYHPYFIWQDGQEASIAQQHAFIDAMCRAVQITVPSAVIWAKATKLDSNTVLQRIQEHCGIVGVPIHFRHLS